MRFSLFILLLIATPVLAQFDPYPGPLMKPWNRQSATPIIGVDLAKFYTNTLIDMYPCCTNWACISNAVANGLICNGTNGFSTNSATTIITNVVPLTVLGYARTENSNSLPITSIVHYGSRGTNDFVYGQGYSNLMTVSYSPVNTNDGLLVEVLANTFMQDQNGAMALFQDPASSNSTAIAIAPIVAGNSSHLIGQTTISKMVMATTTNRTTFTVNLGVNSGHLWFNGEGGSFNGPILAGRLVSSISVTEFGIPGGGGCPYCFGGCSTCAPPPCFTITPVSTNASEGCTLPQCTGTPNHFQVFTDTTLTEFYTFCFCSPGSGEGWWYRFVAGVCSNDSALYQETNQSCASYFGTIGALFCDNYWTGHVCCTAAPVTCTYYVGPVVERVVIDGDGTGTTQIWQGDESGLCGELALVGGCPAGGGAAVALNGNCITGYRIDGYSTALEPNGEYDCQPGVVWNQLLLPSGP